MFTVFADSAANLPDGLIKQYDIKIIPIKYTIGDKEYDNSRPETSFSTDAFYRLLREKAEIKTSLINTGNFIDLFSPLLAAGQDVLFVGLSSGLSGTIQAARLAAEDLAEQFPGREIAVIDALTGGMAEGLLACEAAKLRQAGCTLQETVDKVNALRENANIYFVVDDLFYLKRGGRLSGAAAVISTVLNIKPILAAGMDGKITLREKIRGRKASIERLAALFIDRCSPDKNQTVGIHHGDCPEDAEHLMKLIRNSGKAKNIIIDYLDPALGVHSGPGTLALSFMGEAR